MLKHIPKDCIFISFMSSSPFSPMAERRNTSSGKLRPLEVFGADEADYVPRMRSSLLNRNPPPKTTIAAIIMLIGGIICISIGLSIMFSNVITHGKDRGVAILVLGGLMFIPGSYASVVIYGTWSGWEGYDYSMLPSYDDE